MKILAPLVIDADELADGLERLTQSVERATSTR